MKTADDIRRVALDDPSRDLSRKPLRRLVLVPAQGFVGQWLSSFREFPPRQKPASFSLNQVMQQLTGSQSN